MAAEIKNLDTDLQMLVYENYNKFISATDTIKRYLVNNSWIVVSRCLVCVCTKFRYVDSLLGRMKSNIFGMEGNMDQLLHKVFGTH